MANLPRRIIKVNSEKDDREVNNELALRRPRD